MPSILTVHYRIVVIGFFMSTSKRLYVRKAGFFLIKLPLLWFQAFFYWKKYYTWDWDFIQTCKFISLSFKKKFKRHGKLRGEGKSLLLDIVLLCGTHGAEVSSTPTTKGRVILVGLEYKASFISWPCSFSITTKKTD